MSVLTSLTYLPALDGLRAVAILLVIGRHVLWDDFAGGRLGVDVFLVLSGFLITTLIWQEIERTGTIDRRAFLRRRAKRLLPALFVVAGVFSLVFAVLHRPLLDYVVSAILAVTQLTAPPYAMGLPGTFGAFHHTWSLSIEWWFYVVWPVFVLAAWETGRRRAFAIMLVVAGVAFLVPFVVENAAYLMRSGGLVLGGAVALWVLAGRYVPSVAPLVGLVLIGAAVASGQAVWSFGVTAVGSALVVAGLASGGGIVASTLSWRPMVWLGVISYEVYLIHFPGIYLLQSLGAGLAEKCAWIVVCIALSALLHALVGVRRQRSRPALVEV